MTQYEQFVTIATYLKANWTITPLFIRGEVISIEAPYVIYDSFGINSKSTLSGCTTEELTGHSISVFGVNNAKCKKLSSIFQAQFKNTNAEGLNIGDIVDSMGVLKIEDDLYENKMIFKTITIN